MKRLVLGFLCLLGIAAVLAGCNMPQRADVSPTETAVEPDIPEVIPEPTETPTPPPAQDKIALLALDPLSGVTLNLNRALDQICGNSYDCITVSNENDIENDTDFVILAQETTGLSALTERFPDTTFIMVSDPDGVYENAWTIPYDEAYLPFLAGLATASNAYDWRSVGLIPSDSPIWGSHAEEAFVNGAHYFCGSCISTLAPYVSFPLVISLPSDTSADIWSSQFDEAQRSTVYTAFVSDEAMSEGLLQKLMIGNMQILGISTPPAGLENNWLASVSFDWAATLRQIIARAEAGERSGSLPLILSVTPGSLTDNFSEGKTRVLENAYSDLLSGKLSAYTSLTEYSE